MYTFIYGWLLWICHLNPLTQDTSPIQLTIQVSGMESSEGSIQVAIFNTAEEFLEKPYQQRVANIESMRSVQLEVSLPAGQYAIAAYHDENQNQELDKNFVGIPKEAYGFSNDERGTRLGEPSFEDVNFTLNQSNKTIQINLR